MTEQRTPEIQFGLERVYVKDISYEAPSTPHVFLQQSQPQVDIQLGVQHSEISAADGVYEAIVVATVSAKQADKTVFLVEVQQAGLFRIHGMTGENLQRALEIGCPNILLPFVREAINDLVGKGGFPQLLINPINFESLYEQKQKQAAAKKSAQH
ncbi:MAG: protein-export chaperone SecB [Gammaproteobacteria bacterium]|nr:protein-export chaperone SecB [Gammaproteobacteria bacterium]